MSNIERIELSSEALADKLGQVLADKSKLMSVEKEIKKVLIERGIAAIDGNQFRVTVSHIQTQRVNWQKIAEKFDISRQLKRAYTKISESDRVSCKSLKSS